MNCSHWWIIEPANGPTSRGKCRLCGEEKDFYNSLDYILGLKGLKAVGTKIKKSRRVPLTEDIPDESLDLADEELYV